MLSRRHIRIKVFQSLYAYFQEDNPDSVAVEKQLNKSIDRIYELYMYELRLLYELKLAAEHFIDLALNKKLPTHSDLDPNRRFVDNQVLKIFFEDDGFIAACEKYNVSWSEERHFTRSLYQELKNSDLFKAYMDKPNTSFSEDKAFLREVYEVFIVHNEDLYNLYEEKNLYWADDLDAAQMMVDKTFKKLKLADLRSPALVKLFKDADDETFASKLFRYTLKTSAETQNRIATKAQNWEMDRIAAIDVILMKMAVAEFIHFETIPLKVSMNEYIELSKGYSTPKSSLFINGILDRILNNLKEEGKIKKIGRGLLET
jgi:transcription antitermination protein NusB